jgi:hypothetical protein
MEAGAPVIARLRAGYWGLIHDASLDWKNSSEFFGKGVIPRAPHTEPRGPLCRPATAVIEVRERFTAEPGK